MNVLLKKLGIRLPIIQAPMAGVDTPTLTAAVSNSGGLGSIGAGSMDAETLRKRIADVRALTSGPFNVNVFCHQPARRDEAREANWLTLLAPEFARYGASPPERLHEIYPSFPIDDAKLAVLLQTRPAVVSFHFGLPSPDRIDALRSAGITLIATATSRAEGEAIAAAGIDAVVAQGFEAGGHRGVFDPHSPDARLGTLALTRLLVSSLTIPVIAAGGIMDGAGIAAALVAGAAAAQLGTAFICSAESAADAAYRARLLSADAERTVVTAAISGRPARSLPNRLTALVETVDPALIPSYPVTYDAAKALHAAAKAQGETGYGPQWAGQGAPLARESSAAELMACLEAELLMARSRGISF